MSGGGGLQLDAKLLKWEPRNEPTGHQNQQKLFVGFSPFGFTNLVFTHLMCDHPVYPVTSIHLVFSHLIFICLVVTAIFLVI